MEENTEYTSFSKVYDVFLSKITDDMYMQLSEQDTMKLLKEILISAIPYFQFPRISLQYKQIEDEITGQKQDVFINNLTDEQINVLATYMIVEWLGQQLASVENVRMKYSGADFKFTSQANHMQKLLQMKKDYERVGRYVQRLYKRRKKDQNGIYKSTFGSLMQNQPRGGTGVWNQWL